MLISADWRPSKVRNTCLRLLWPETGPHTVLSSGYGTDPLFRVRCFLFYFRHKSDQLKLISTEESVIHHTELNLFHSTLCQNSPSREGKRGAKRKSLRRRGKFYECTKHAFYCKGAIIFNNSTNL